MAIKDWSTTAANNNSAPPDGAPEATTLVSDVNDIMREMMAQTRSFYENLDLRDLGLALEATGPSTGIVFTGDVSAHFATGQKIKYTDASTTITANVVSVSVATNTTVTVDDGAGGTGTVTHAVTQVWAGLPPAGMPGTITANLVGDVTGDVTGDLTGNVTGDLTGDIVLGSDADGDVYYRNSSALQRLAKGTDGQVLTLASGIPSWAANTGVFTEKYETVTPAVITTGANDYSEAHSLSGRPKIFGVYIRCVANDAASGYVTGDEIDAADFGGSGTLYANVWANATHVGISVFNTFTNLMGNLVNKTGGGIGVTATTNFKWVIRAYY